MSILKSTAIIAVASTLLVGCQTLSERLFGDPVEWNAADALASQPNVILIHAASNTRLTEETDRLIDVPEQSVVVGAQAVDPAGIRRVGFRKVAYRAFCSDSESAISYTSPEAGPDPVVISADGSVRTRIFQIRSVDLDGNEFREICEGDGRLTRIEADVRAFADNGENVSETGVATFVHEPEVELQQWGILCSCHRRQSCGPAALPPQNSFAVCAATKAEAVKIAANLCRGDTCYLCVTQAVIQTIEPCIEE